MRQPYRKNFLFILHAQRRRATIWKVGARQKENGKEMYKMIKTANRKAENSILSLKLIIISEEHLLDKMIMKKNE